MISNILKEIDEYLDRGPHRQINGGSDLHHKIKDARKMLCFTNISTLELEITRLREELSTTQQQKG